MIFIDNFFSAEYIRFRFVFWTKLSFNKQTGVTVWNQADGISFGTQSKNTEWLEKMSLV